MFLLQVVLKCADIGHLAAAPKVHKRWAVQLEEEFFRQVHLTSSKTLKRVPASDPAQPIKIEL